MKGPLENAMDRAEEVTAWERSQNDVYREHSPADPMFIRVLAGEVKLLRKAIEMYRAHIPESLCLHCSGYGRRPYGSTATWRGGIGGQAVTDDVCDKCWGTGDADRHGVNLRAMESEFRRLREVEARMKGLEK